jgi:hypothetical protein
LPSFLSLILLPRLPKAHQNNLAPCVPQPSRRALHDL